MSAMMDMMMKQAGLDPDDIRAKMKTFSEQVAAARKEQLAQGKMLRELYKAITGKDFDSGDQTQVIRTNPKIIGTGNGTPDADA